MTTIIKVTAINDMPINKMYKPTAQLNMGDIRIYFSCGAPVTKMSEENFSKYLKALSEAKSAMKMFHRDFLLLQEVMDIEEKVWR